MEKLINVLESMIQKYNIDENDSNTIQAALDELVHGPVDGSEGKEDFEMPEMTIVLEGSDDEAED